MIKVLVVDDSALMRKYLRAILEAAGGFEVVTARNGVEALDQIGREDPAVVMLDINMPEMDGLTCLGRIMQDSPRPVVMVSSLTTNGALATFEALELGAVDYVGKPGGTVSLNINDVADELVAKVRAAATARVRLASGLMARARLQQGRTGPGARRQEPARGTRVAVVVIGSSTGGPAILPLVIGSLPADFGAPVVIAQHIPANFSRHLAARIDSSGPLPAIEVTGTHKLEPGHVYLGAGDADVVMARRAGGLVVCRVPSDPSRRWHPSVDRLVASAMETFDPSTIVAVQLTGMGDDGAERMTAVHARGGRAIAESEDSAVVWGMPGELVRMGGADKVLAVDKIAAQVAAWARG